MGLFLGLVKLKRIQFDGTLVELEESFRSKLYLLSLGIFTSYSIDR